MKTVAIIQARHTSTRLPGKMLLPLAGIPVIEHIIVRARSVSEIDQICVTIPEGDAQAPLAEFIVTMDDVHLSRGPEDYLLHRYAIAAAETKADTIIRLWGDCPAIDPDAIRLLIKTFRAEKTDWAYLDDKSGSPLGYECQAFQASSLKEASQEAQDQVDLEALHTFLDRHPDRFSKTSIWRNGTPGNPPSPYQILLDTFEDYQKLQRIFDMLYPTSALFGLSEIEGFAACEPSLFTPPS